MADTEYTQIEYTQIFFETPEARTAYLEAALEVSERREFALAAERDALRVRVERLEAALAEIAAQQPDKMTQALQAIATSGQNNSVIYLPTNPSNGLPIVPTSNSVTPSK